MLFLLRCTIVNSDSPFWFFVWLSAFWMLAIGGTTKFGFLLDQLNWSLRKEAQSCCVTTLSCWFLRFSFSIQNSVCSFFFFYHLFVIGTTGNILPQRSSFFDCCVLFSPSTTYILGCLNFITLYHHNKKKKKKTGRRWAVAPEVNESALCWTRSGKLSFTCNNTNMTKKKVIAFLSCSCVQLSTKKEGGNYASFFPSPLIRHRVLCSCVYAASLYTPAILIFHWCILGLRGASTTTKQQQKKKTKAIRVVPLTFPLSFTHQQEQESCIFFSKPLKNYSWKLFFFLFQTSLFFVSFREAIFLLLSTSMLRCSRLTRTALLSATLVRRAAASSNNVAAAPTSVDAAKSVADNVHAHPVPQEKAGSVQHSKEESSVPSPHVAEEAAPPPPHHQPKFFFKGRRGSMAPEYYCTRSNAGHPDAVAELVGAGRDDPEWMWLKLLCFLCVMATFGTTLYGYFFAEHIKFFKDEPWSPFTYWKSKIKNDQFYFLRFIWIGFLFVFFFPFFFVWSTFCRACSFRLLSQCWLPYDPLFCYFAVAVVVVGAHDSHYLRYTHKKKKRRKRI